MKIGPDKNDDAVIHFFQCGACGSQIFWSEMNPSVERAALVFKWVRAGCPNPDCAGYLILSAPDKTYACKDARAIYDQKKDSGEKVYWI